MSAELSADPQRPISWRDGRAITRAEFADQVQRVAAALPPGSHLLNLCRDRYAFMLGFVAACWRGQINLLPSAEAPGLLARLAEQYGHPLQLSDEVLFELLARAPPDLPARAGEGEKPAALVFTSGSSGEPQAHSKLWPLLADTVARSGEVLLGSTFAHVVATVPPQHMYGLEFSVMLALAGRAAVHSGRPLFPRDISEALAQVPAPRVLLTTPLHLRALAQSGIALPALHRVISATAPLDRELAAMIEQRLGCPVIEIYGCTEAGSLASRRTVEGRLWRPHPGVRIDIVDGHTRVSAPYLPQSQALQDQVRLDHDGRFELLGRRGDLLKVAGKRASLRDITRHLLAIDGVQDGVIFQPTVGDAARLAGLVVAPSLSVGEILEALARHLDPAFLPRPLRKLAQLPRDGLGKLPRAALLEALGRPDE